MLSGRGCCMPLLRTLHCLSIPVLSLRPVYRPPHNLNQRLAAALRQHVPQLSLPSSLFFFLGRWMRALFWRQSGPASLALLFPHSLLPGIEKRGRSAFFGSGGVIDACAFTRPSRQVRRRSCDLCVGTELCELRCSPLGWELRGDDA